jgi:hypothetical protein
LGRAGVLWGWGWDWLGLLGLHGVVRVGVVRCGGLAPLLAPGRGTYGSVWSAAFQRCKGRAKIVVCA